MRRQTGLNPSNMGLVVFTQLTTIISCLLMEYSLDNFQYKALALLTIVATTIFFIPIVIQLLKR